MFALRNPQQPIAVYAEWTVFAVLIAALVGLWWVLEFGSPGLLSNKQNSMNVSDAVINKLITGTTAPQAVPLSVQHALLASKTTTSVAATSVPADVIQSLSAPKN